MKSDVIDILFENRNKAYGAYNLRKHYSERLNKAFGIIMILAAGFAAITFLAKKTGLITPGYDFVEIELPTVRENITEPQKKPDLPKPQPKTTIVAQKMFASPVIVDNTKANIIQNINEVDNIGNKNIISPHSGPAIVQPPVTGNGENPVPDPPKIDITTPFDPNTVDVQPAYPGGMDALRKFLEKHLQNPKEMEEGESVTVRVRFVVGYDGKLQSFVTVQDGGEEFNKEVIRVLKKMPAWVPGKAKGENVSVYYIIPIKFVPAN